MNMKNRSALAVPVLTFFSLLFANCSNATTSATSASNTGSTGGSFVNCVSTPTSGITLSSANSVSHNAGISGGCMAGSTCHGSTGTANIKWGVAGTMYSSATMGSAVLVSTGSITIGATTLPVDSCGNFYSTVALTGSATSSSAGNPVMTAAIGAGNSNCNAGSCHDGTSSIPMGVGGGTRIY